MTRIPGLETIMGLAGEPPPEIAIDRKTIIAQQKLVQIWNSAYIAIIPYCFKCKAPLVWHQAPREEGHENEMFTCPNCNRVWILKEGQYDKVKENTKTANGKDSKK